VAGGGIGAAALVRALAGALGGPARRSDVAHLSDLQPQETASLGVLAVLVITLGLAPRLLLQATHTGAAVFAGPTAPPPAAIARPRAPSPPAAAPPPLPRRPG
jgi:NADH:ubiquinone oxidoreductase subunit 4 (subunit M)